MSSEENHLIERLPAPERERLLSGCENVPLVPGAVLCRRGEPAAHAWFPTTGCIALVAQVDAHPGLEVGMVGREGMLGVPLVLGVTTSPLHALVLGAGTAWRITQPDFDRELRRLPALRQLLLLYVHVVKLQLAAGAGCLRFHLIEPRLARWLLMRQDRAHADQFHVTHELLATMLGVRRVGITVAAGKLQREGLIGYHRGEMRVLDRAKLEARACSCYATDRATYCDVLA